jgi:hypothetical protein
MPYFLHAIALLGDSVWGGIAVMAAIPHTGARAVAMPGLLLALNPKSARK